MKKNILILILMALALGILSAQPAPAVPEETNATPVVTPPRGIRQYTETQELIIELKSQIPDTDVFQDKSDTYNKAGLYGFTFDQESLEENSEILLNKWLKESK